MENIIGVKNPKIVNHFMKNYIFPQVGRPIDEERKLLFEKLCEWIDEEVEHGVTTLAEIHMKMLQLDPIEDKSLAYGRRYLKTKLQEEYKESLYFTSGNCVPERHDKCSSSRLSSTGNHPLAHS